MESGGKYISQLAPEYSGPCGLSLLDAFLVHASPKLYRGQALTKTVGVCSF
jgi:hypothetical protein